VELFYYAGCQLVIWKKLAGDFSGSGVLDFWDISPDGLVVGFFRFKGKETKLGHYPGHKTLDSIPSV
jgi:hypothetical protein